MFYSLALCDDEKAMHTFLAPLVGAWARRAGHLVSLSSFESAEAFLFAYAENKAFDILLLDIEMGGLTGVELARRIRAENESIQIVFVTGYSEYITEGYEVAALHYLMKPIQPEKLFEVLDRAAKKLQRNERCLLLPIGCEVFRVPLHEIRYVEVRQNYVTIHAKGEYTLKRSLGEMEKELDEQFFRVGRSCILNLACVRRITKTEVFLSDGTGIPLPRGMYEALNRALIAHT